MITERDSKLAQGQPGLTWRTLDLAGKSAIEASAGTGKTYTLVLLVLRLLLERELAPSAILLATFTESATLELRARVTERVRQAYFAALNATDPKRLAYTQEQMADDDPLAHYLAARWHGDYSARGSVRLRDEKILERAMLQLDDMPIRTLHGVCRALSSSFDLVPGDLDADIEEGDSLTEAALDDAFRRRFADVKALPEAQSDALDSGYLRTLRDGVKRVLKNGRITLRAPARIDAQHYRKARTALFRRQFRQELAEVLSQPPEQWHLRVDARRAIENLLRMLKQGSGRQLHKASLAPFLQPEAAQLQKARRSILDSRAMAQLCNFAQLHQLARRGEFAWLLNTLVTEVGLSRSTALAARGGVSFDSMIAQLADRLAPFHAAAVTSQGETVKRVGDVSARAAVQLANAIHQRYPVALIDEFQDTDAQQWAILQAIYGTRGGLILVGDPKQSIYRFRGSDVHTFVRATKACDRYFLQHNYRASAPLVAALNCFYSAQLNPFHSDDIVFRAAEVGRTDSEATLGATTPLCFIEVIDPERRYSPSDACLRAACSDIKNVLQAAKSTAIPSIALILSTNRQVRMAQEFMLKLGVHAAASASLGVYQSEAAEVLHSVLDALAAPTDLTRARAARLALQLEPLDRLSALGERELFRWVERYLAQMLTRGVSFVCLSIAVERVGADAQFASDANHLAELLALDEQTLLETQPSLRQRSTDYAQALAQQLSAHIKAPERSTDATEARRIAAGAQVHVMTVHKAKGLEFDLVYLPTLCFAKAPDANIAIVPGVHGLEADAGSVDFRTAIQLEADETLAELLRLQYVALTRAKQAVHVYFHADIVKDSSALGWHLAQIASSQRIEQAQDSAVELAWEDQINAVPERVIAADTPWRTGLQRLVEQESIGYLVHEVGDFESLHVTATTLSTTGYTPLQTNLLPLMRPAQRRISFSSMTRSEFKPDAPTATESDGLALNFELAAELTGLPMDSHRIECAAPNSHPEIIALENFRGPNFGLALHALFEDALPAQSAFNTDQVAARVSQFGLAANAENAQEILALLLRNRSTEVIAELKLAGLNATNSVAELGFQLPVSGLDYRALAELGPRFGLPMLFLPEQALERVNGMLTGFIDLVFQHDGKFYLLDYKSNWLGASVQDYSGAALDAAMSKHNYHLQHLLYALALHRYLRHSLPDYDFETHFGGAHYLFVRAFGLAASAEGDVGHYQYRASQALIEALDAMFSSVL